MKKVLILLAMWLISGILCCNMTMAADGGMAERIAEKAGYTTEGITEYSLSQNIGVIIRSVLSVLGVIFLVLTIYAGILWGTAAGNEDKVDKAKKILISAFIGLVIVGAAYGITSLVFYFLGVGSAPSTDVDVPWSQQ
ncbi:MAG: hypothetical protein COU29_02570 [Candidatus Magasanikbacteria bacterium CG10_big_fil_rev_8_21_14_0_10_36_32]|uniref:DUF4134 domain-containing protein n=1 Tax=Candidatus Magasanikbacteria bacterium CG10_big_fil_rev_8_21_14_0_10_36_32 TaxID=1974646 RepID=A0A2M6W781_9BACT|nr:MAG: hypothetical protein COU29_02570 [Candidatus Magasanikbacteria bacterium CG10_big_fil_rev_8_21_14_0_10_36_32]